MDDQPLPDRCTDCPGRIVCRCLQVTETALVEKITSLELRTVREVRRHTGAGEGCTCCHAEILRYLEQLCPARAACA
jgi:NAD(P)H-nitrite reductase large subunit